MLLSIRNVEIFFAIKMGSFTMFITAVCVLFLIKLQFKKAAKTPESVNYRVEVLETSFSSYNF